MHNILFKIYVKREKKLIAVTLFLFLFVFGHGASAATLSLKQGEILLYPITSTDSQSAYLGNQNIPIVKYNGHDYALVAVSASQKTGNYYIHIKNGSKESEKKIINVKNANYKRVLKGVPYQFATLSKDKQEIVTKDKAPLLPLLAKASQVNTSQIWQSIFINPLDSVKVTSPFGYKRVYTNYSTVHQGVDLKAAVGTPVYAISDGEVMWGEGKALYLEGPMIAIDHGDGIVSEYLHLSKVLVQTGAQVKAGDIIGYSGAQGADVTGPHLHFAVKVGNVPVNPLQFIKVFQTLKVL